ncbi:MAG TPA: hypothetical protein VFP47_00505 [Pyrinomonadaceae bacterium]|nr:hypothetical protein [Pyrinomonadaceae bacterium]
MFITRKSEDQGLQKVIDAHLDSMVDEDPGSVEYARKVEQLTKLYSLKEKTSERRVSPDTLAIVAGNLAGILLIVGHEKAHVVTSKALGFILKAR